MTGFAQASGACGEVQWAWEIKAVNAKGLDLRLRLPPGFDGIDLEARRRIAARLIRGTCQANLAINREAAAAPRVNTVLLTSLIRTLAEVQLPASVGPATLDGLLAIRGVVEMSESTPGEADTKALFDVALEGLEQALDALVAMRVKEGTALATVIEERLATIGRLTSQADAAPQRQPAAIQEKLASAVAALLGRHAFDPDRLHQEALLLAVKADVREELDRLAAHVAAATDLIAAGGGVGRRLDFLAQEMSREASTFCAKVNDAALTAIGLELRVAIEQLREQVQNIE